MGTVKGILKAVAAFRGRNFTGAFALGEGNSSGALNSNGDRATRGDPTEITPEGRAEVGDTTRADRARSRVEMKVDDVRISLGRSMKVTN